MAKTARTRERSEKVKVRNTVLMVIYSSRLTFIHVQQASRDVKEMYNYQSFFVSAGFLQNIGCPRRASYVGRGCCLG